MGCIIVGFRFRRRDVADGFKQPAADRFAQEALKPRLERVVEQFDDFGIALHASSWLSGALTHEQGDWKQEIGGNPPFMLLSISRSYGRSGDHPKLGARQVAAGFVDQLLRVVKAASALRLVAEHLVCLFGRSQPAPGELPKLVFGDGVADAYDHGDHYTR